MKEGLQSKFGTVTVSSVCKDVWFSLRAERLKECESIINNEKKKIKIVSLNLNNILDIN